MNDYTSELRRLDDAIAQDELSSSGSTLVFHLFQRAQLTGSRDELARTERRLQALIAELGPRSDLCLLQANIDIALHRFNAAKLALCRSAELEESSFGRALAGDLAVQSGDFGQALVEYEAAIAEDPCWDNLARLAHLKGVVGAVEAADELYQAAEDELTAKQMRAYAWLELQRGQLAFKHGNFDAAEARYERAGSAYSGHWLIDSQRAELLAAESNWTNAMSLYEDVARRVGRPELWHAAGDAAAGAGESALAHDYHERARAGYLQSVEQGDVHYVHHLADFYLDVDHDLKQAVRWAQYDAELRPNPWTLSLLGWATYLDGRPAEALATICPAVQSGVADAELFQQWATIYAANSRSLEEHIRTN